MLYFFLLQLVTLGDEVLALGGENWEEGSLDSVEVWQPGTGAWRLKSEKLAERRAGFRAVALNREIVCPKE